MKKPVLNTREVRFVGGKIELEYREDGGVKTPLAFVGNSIVCGSRSLNLGGFVEIIDSKALNEADMSDVVGLFNHNRDILLGRNTSNTLKLTRNTDGGLSYWIAYDPLDPDHVRVMRKIERGDVVGSSFAFRVAKGGDTWVKEEDGTYLRTVYKISRVSDVGPVTSPAYANSTAAKRSLDSLRTETAPTTGVPLSLRKRQLQLLAHGH
jgi:HK97 family phage prohead protease